MSIEKNPKKKKNVAELGEEVLKTVSAENTGGTGDKKYSGKLDEGSKTKLEDYFGVGADSEEMKKAISEFSKENPGDLRNILNGNLTSPNRKKEGDSSSKNGDREESVLSMPPFLKQETASSEKEQEDDSHEETEKTEDTEGTKKPNNKFQKGNKWMGERITRDFDKIYSIDELESQKQKIIDWLESEVQTKSNLTTESLKSLNEKKASYMTVLDNKFKERESYLEDLKKRNKEEKDESPKKLKRIEEAENVIAKKAELKKKLEELELEESKKGFWGKVRTNSFFGKFAGENEIKKNKIKSEIQELDDNFRKTRFNDIDFERLRGDTEAKKMKRKKELYRVLAERSQREKIKNEKLGNFNSAWEPLLKSRGPKFWREMDPLQKRMIKTAVISTGVGLVTGSGIIPRMAGGLAGIFVGMGAGKLVEKTFDAGINIKIRALEAELDKFDFSKNGEEYFQQAEKKREILEKLEKWKKIAVTGVTALAGMETTLEVRNYTEDFMIKNDFKDLDGSEVKDSLKKEGVFMFDDIFKKWGSSMIGGESSGTTPESGVRKSLNIFQEQGGHYGEQYNVKNGDSLSRIISREMMAKDLVAANIDPSQKPEVFKKIFEMVKENPTLYGITSGDINLIHPGDTINLEQIYKDMKSYNIFSGMELDVEVVIGEDGQVYVEDADGNKDYARISPVDLENVFSKDELALIHENTSFSEHKIFEDNGNLNNEFLKNIESHKIVKGDNVWNIIKDDLIKSQLMKNPDFAGIFDNNLGEDVVKARITYLTDHLKDIVVKNHGEFGLSGNNIRCFLRVGNSLDLAKLVEKGIDLELLKELESIGDQKAVSINNGFSDHVSCVQHHRCSGNVINRVVYYPVPVVVEKHIEYVQKQVYVQRPAAEPVRKIAHNPIRRPVYDEVIVSNIIPKATGVGNRYNGDTTSIKYKALNATDTGNRYDGGGFNVNYGTQNATGTGNRYDGGGLSVNYGTQNATGTGNRYDGGGLSVNYGTQNATGTGNRYDGGGLNVNYGTPNATGTGAHFNGGGTYVNQGTPNATGTGVPFNGGGTYVNQGIPNPTPTGNGGSGDGLEIVKTKTDGSTPPPTDIADGPQGHLKNQTVTDNSNNSPRKDNNDMSNKMKA